MIKHIKGNLLDLAEKGKFDIIVHGCNCQNTMGSGIAKEIRERYPDAYDADTSFANRFVEYTPEQRLGNYSECKAITADLDKSVFKIINAYTQVNFMPRGVDHFEYESFNLILRKLAAIYPGKRFGFPYIGMGLAGGDKNRIIAMLEDFAEQVSAKGGSVTLVSYEP